MLLVSMDASRTEVTQLLQAWALGRHDALDRLLPAIYGELRRLAASYLRRERRDHTLQATALVHEAFLKLVDQRDVRWQNRAHFFGIAAQLMRRILIDHARAHTASKRGSGERPLQLVNPADHLQHRRVMWKVRHRAVTTTDIDPCVSGNLFSGEI